MNGWLVSAAVLCALISLAHSIIGEWRIFRHLRQVGRVVPTEGSNVLREFQVRIIWGTWHGLSVVGLGLSGILMWLAQPGAQAASGGQLEWCVAITTAATGMLVLVSNRARHPAWVALLLVAGLVLMSL